MEIVEFKNKVFAELEKRNIWVLGTSADNRLTARNVSTIFMNGKIYFQTDIQFLKYIQIRQNKLNIQIEGIAQVLGHPTEKQNQEFLNMFSQKHKDSFEKYTYLPNEVVIEVTPKYIEMWAYENGRPCVYNLNLKNDDFSRRDYSINHNMELNESPFKEMKNGSEIIEYRLNDEKMQLVKVRDTILFTKLPNLDEKLLTEVVDIQKFKTFYDAFKTLQYQNHADADDADEADIENEIAKAVTSMRRFYSQEEEEKYGTVAIQSKILKKVKGTEML